MQPKENDLLKEMLYLQDRHRSMTELMDLVVTCLVRMFMEREWYA